MKKYRKINLNIYEISDLSEINEVMLCRGIPIAKDDFGYNKPHYGKCKAFIGYLSYSQAAIICKIFFTYINTQLGYLDKSKLKRSLTYYSKLARLEKNLDYHINISRYTDEEVEICFNSKVNQDMVVYLNELIKVVPDLRCEGTRGKEKYYCKNNFVDKLIYLLNYKGGYINRATARRYKASASNKEKDKTINDVNNKILVMQEYEERQKNTLTLNFILADKNIVIKFSYYEELVKLMNKNNGYWSRDEKKWYIKPINALPLLEDLKTIKVKGYKYLDYSSLENLKDNIKEILENQKGEDLKEIIIAKKISENRVSLSFKYDKNIISKIQTFSSELKKWDGKKREWEISSFILPELISYIDEKVYNIDTLKENAKGLVFDFAIKKEKKYFKIVTKTFPTRDLYRYMIKAAHITQCTFSEENNVVLVKDKELGKIKNFAKELTKVKISYTLNIEELLSSIELLERKINELAPKLINFDNFDRKPFKNQIEGAKEILDKKTCILGDPMGLGKTCTAILSAESIQGKKIVVVPSILKYNWEKELRMITKSEIHIIEGRAEKYYPKKIGENDYVIIAYSNLKYQLNRLVNENFSIALYDEGHFLKSVSSYGTPSSDRALAAIKLGEEIEYKVVITGTPIPNKTKDIFNLLRLIEHPLANDFRFFTSRYCNAKQTEWGIDIDGSSNQEELYQEISTHMIRRSRNENEMPKKIKNFIPIEINLKEYKKHIVQYKKKLREEKNIILSPKQQMAQHLVEIQALKLILENEKVKHTIELAETLLNQNLPVVIFCNYSEPIDTIKAHFKEKAVVVDGRTSNKLKQKYIDDFQNGEVDVFIGNVKAAGVGITLTRSHNVIFNGYDWNPNNLAQCEDRVWRIGQTEDCIVNYLYARSAEIDEVLTEMLEEKLVNSSAIIDNKKESFIGERKTLKNLFKLFYKNELEYEIAIDDADFELIE